MNRPTQKLWYLANRISRNAEVLRESRIPSHLTLCKRRMLRHLNELNHVRDYWADHYPITRKRGRTVSPYPQMGLSYWQNRARFRKE